MAGAECERNEGPNAGTCPVIKDSAQHESFVRQQHHSPPGLTPECRAALSSKAGRMSFTFLCLLWKIWSGFFPYSSFASLVKKALFAVPVVRQRMLAWVEALSGRGEKQMGWHGGARAAPACVWGVCRKMADISRWRMHDGRPPLRKHNSPFLSLQQPCLNKMYWYSFLPCLKPSCGRISQYYKTLFFKKKCFTILLKWNREFQYVWIDFCSWVALGIPFLSCKQCFLIYILNFMVKKNIFLQKYKTILICFLIFLLSLNMTWCDGYNIFFSEFGSWELETICRK